MDNIKPGDIIRTFLDAIGGIDDLLEEDEGSSEYLKRQRNIKKLRATTSVIYDQIILDFDAEGKDTLDTDLVSTEYKKRVCELSSEDLEYLLWGDEEGLMNRADDTLEAIKAELFERSVINKKSD